MKRIGITQKIVFDKNNVLCDLLESSYSSYFSKLGIILVPISNFTEDTKKYLEELKLEGFILSGGNNVNPNLYNSSEIMGDVFEQRDKTEKCVMDYAIEKKLPVFGICRGFEFINVYFKGKLSKVDAKTHIAKIHEIKVSNEKKNIIVNSYHELGIERNNLSDELEPFSICLQDNTVESFKHKKLAIIGVMWHPERNKLKQDEKFNEKLITSFFKV